MTGICDLVFYANPPQGPNEIDVVCGTDCRILLDFRTSGGCASPLYGSLVEVFVWSAFQDPCNCEDDEYMARWDNTLGGNVVNHCPKLGQFILDIRRQDVCRFPPGSYCWKVKVSTPKDLITATGTADVLAGSPHVEIKNGDNPVFDRGLLFLGTNELSNQGPHLVYPEIVTAPLDVLSSANECCECPVEVNEDLGVEIGPTGNLLAPLADFVTQSGAPFAVYSIEESFPPQMTGRFVVKGCP